MAGEGTNAAATLSVAVSTKEAVDNLQLLSTKLKEVREAAGVPVSSKGIKDLGGFSKEVSSQLTGVQAEVKSALSGSSAGAKDAAKAMAGYRTTIDGVTHSFREQSKLSKDAVKDFVAQDLAAKEAAKAALDLAKAKNAANSLELRVIKTEELAKVK